MTKSVVVFIVAVFALILSSNDVVAQTKPITGLRDYNGTYYGAPGTGTIGYAGGTLWRDNQNGGIDIPSDPTKRGTGCNGEGCGSHPGVDIPIPSGTSVIASYAGTVVRSECNGGTGTGWGGLVVTQSTIPSTGETIFVTYAHLRARYYSVGTYVSEGTVLGESGGNPSVDFCPGFSTGAHLHFQIDKDDGNNSPYYPSGPSGVNVLDDTNIYAKTYNPVVMVSGKYRWTFGQDGNYENWTAVNVEGQGVFGGDYWTDGKSDPWIWRHPDARIYCGLPSMCSGGIAAEAAHYKYFQVILTNNCVSNPMRVYYITHDQRTWDATKSVAFNYTGPGLLHEVYMGNAPYWYGTIIGIRFDPAENCTTGTNDINYIHSMSLRR